MSKKSIISLVIIMSLMLAMVVIPASAEEWPLSVRVNDEEVIFPDAVPFIDANGRTQVPVRFVSEALSATVEWINETRQVVIVKEDKTITLTIGKKEMTINGQTKVLDSAPLIKEGRTFVPVRFVSEGLGAKVDWEAITRTVFIDTTGTVSSGNLEMITSSETVINGVKIPLSAGDDASKFGGKVQIIKKSQLGITEVSDESVLLCISLSRGPKADYLAEMNETKDLVSRIVSADVANKVYSYCEKYSKEGGDFFYEEIIGGLHKVEFEAPPEGPIMVYILK